MLNDLLLLEWFYGLAFVVVFLPSGFNALTITCNSYAFKFFQID